MQCKKIIWRDPAYPPPSFPNGNICITVVYYHNQEIDILLPF